MKGKCNNNQERLLKIILAPYISEKATFIADKNNQTVFKVVTDANKNEIKAAIELLDGGATVPFIARYRKEVTNGLDDAQLCFLHVRLIHLREHDERRDAVLGVIPPFQSRQLPQGASDMPHWVTR